VSDSIGVVICYYEQPEYLQQCLESVVNQTRRPNEVVVVDDGSCLFPLRNELLKVLAPIPMRLAYKKNGGVSGARNHGISELSASLIVTLDADDLLTPDYLAILSATLHKTHASIAYSDIRTFGL